MHKAFSETDWIELKPLTLLMGDNSAGKTALYQVLRMLRYAYEELERESTFENLRPFEQLAGSFSDICNKNSADREVIFSFRFSSVSDVTQTLLYRVRLGEHPNSRDPYGIVNKVETGVCRGSNERR